MCKVYTYLETEKRKKKEDLAKQKNQAKKDNQSHRA